MRRRRMGGGSAGSGSGGGDVGGVARGAHQRVQDVDRGAGLDHPHRGHDGDEPRQELRSCLVVARGRGARQALLQAADGGAGALLDERGRRRVEHAEERGVDRRLDRELLHALEQEARGGLGERRQVVGEQTGEVPGHLGGPVAMDDRVAHLAQLAIRRAHRGGTEPAAAAAAVVAAILSTREEGRERRERTRTSARRLGGLRRRRRSSAFDARSPPGGIGGHIGNAGSRDRRGAAWHAALSRGLKPRTPCLWRLPPL